MFVVAAFYKFAPLDDYADQRQPLQDFCRNTGTCGTILLAAEGINGTIAGSREAIDAVLARLRSDPRLKDLEHKESYAEEMPFLRMKVRLKKEIVTLGDPSVDPNKLVGVYVPPAEWNDLISDPDVLVIDARNDYEVDIGTFKGAIDPKTQAFGEFPDYVKRDLADNLANNPNRKIAMFCTGGIRCEKASSLMLNMGFSEVYHLKGGILKYLEEVPPEESLWQGECFVFDERVSVGHGLQQGPHQLCRGCRYPITAEDRASPEFEAGVSCPHCHDSLTEDQKIRFRERHNQIQLSKARKQRHLGTVDTVGPG